MGILLSQVSPKEAGLSSLVPQSAISTLSLTNMRLSVILSFIASVAPLYAIAIRIPDGGFPSNMQRLDVAKVTDNTGSCGEPLISELTQNGKECFTKGGVGFSRLGSKKCLSNKQAKTPEGRGVCWFKTEGTAKIASSKPRMPLGSDPNTWGPNALRSRPGVEGRQRQPSASSSAPKLRRRARSSLPQRIRPALKVDTTVGPGRDEPYSTPEPAELPTSPRPAYPMPPIRLPPNEATDSRGKH
ncbi:hypothetical protein H0H92_007502 [Tricholoma furcatifolium]|nr:hypothetical protein H0H92_007502 [Tricholoma furcatifolium]